MTTAPQPRADDAETLPEDVAAMTYEQARDELVEVVRTLETGTADLEASISLWERGEALASRCRQWLEGARERIDRAVAARESGGADPGAGPDEGREQA